MVALVSITVIGTTIIQPRVLSADTSSTLAETEQNVGLDILLLSDTRS